MVQDCHAEFIVGQKGDLPEDDIETSPQTLIMMEMVGDRPKTFVLGVTPTVLEPMTLGLTPQIQAAVPLMERTLFNHLEQLGFSHSRLANIDINALIPDSYKRGLISDEE